MFHGLQIGLELALRICRSDAQCNRVERAVLKSLIAGEGEGHDYRPSKKEGQRPVEHALHVGPALHAGDSGHYYLNRALGMGIDGAEWKAAMLGDTVTLEVVHRPWGLARWMGVGPVRGVVFHGDTVYRTGHVRPLRGVK